METSVLRVQTSEFLEEIKVSQQHGSCISGFVWFVILCISTKASVSPPSVSSEEKDKTGFPALQRPLVCARLYKSTSLMWLYLLHLQVVLHLVRILMR